MKVKTMNQLERALIDFFILNSGFVLPVESGWQTMTITSKALRHGVGSLFFMDPEGLWQHRKNLQECERREHS